MKKQILKFAMLMAVPFLLSTQSCKKEEGNTSTSTLGQATITGKIIGNKDLSSGKLDGLQGIKVIATVNLSDLSASAPTGVKVYEATTDADGNYTLTVDAGSKIVNAVVVFPQVVKLEQTQNNGTKEVVEFYSNTSISRNVTLYKGQTKVENAEYIADFSVGTAVIKGKVQYLNNLCEAAFEDQVSSVPAGTKIMLYWEDYNTGGYREVLIDVDASGNYEYAIQTKYEVYVEVKGVKFSGNRKVLSGADCETETGYEYNHAWDDTYIMKNETNIVDILFQ